MAKKNSRRRFKISSHKTVDLHGKEILHSESFNKSKDYIQHGKKSVFQHSVDVANMSVKISRVLPFKFEEKSLVRGALLHDYFQYDWHDKNTRPKVRVIKDIKKLHGFTHPQTALKNANRDFKLNPIEKEIIKKHMWPLTSVPPMCREAWVVTLADKVCSLKETICRY